MDTIVSVLDLLSSLTGFKYLSSTLKKNRYLKHTSNFVINGMSLLLMASLIF